MQRLALGLPSVAQCHATPRAKGLAPRRASPRTAGGAFLLLVTPRIHVHSRTRALSLCPQVIGNISVDKLELHANAFVMGNITCKTLFMDHNTTVVGNLNVNPFAPQVCARLIDRTRALPSRAPRHSCMCPNEIDE